jgi:hypothetical protein
MAVTTRTLVVLNIDDAPGRLGELAACLGSDGVNIDGFQIDRRSIRLLVDDPTKAEQALQSNDYNFTLMDVFEVPLADKPGELARLGKALGKEGINILYTFGVATGAKTPHVYVRVNDPRRAETVLNRFVGKGS